MSTVIKNIIGKMKKQSKSRIVRYRLNMIEIMLGMTVIVVGMVAVIALLPVGLNLEKKAKSQSFAGDVLENWMRYSAGQINTSDCSGDTMNFPADAPNFSVTTCCPFAEISDITESQSGHQALTAHKVWWGDGTVTNLNKVEDLIGRWSTGRFLPEGETVAKSIAYTEDKDIGDIYRNYISDNSCFVTVWASPGPDTSNQHMGTVSPSGVLLVAEGGTLQFIATPADGYEIADVRVGDHGGTMSSIGAVNSFTVNEVTKHTRVQVIFREAADNAPVALVTEIVYTVPENDALIVREGGVLADVSDPEGDTVTAVMGVDVSDGALILNDNGSFAYAPDTGYTGSDFFTTTAIDDGGNAGEEIIVDINIDDGYSSTAGTCATVDSGEALAEMNINPGNSNYNQFFLEKPDGSSFFRVELLNGTVTSYEGTAAEYI